MLRRARRGGCEVLVRGAGPPVVCLPGTMASPLLFQPLADLLDAEVLALPWLEWPGPHDLDRVAAQVVRVLDATGPAVVVGHSTGGALALLAAAGPGHVSDCARAVRVPAAVVNGQHDRARGPVEVGRLAELLGVAATTVDSGHSPCAEVPERFAAVVRDVIARA